MKVVHMGLNEREITFLFHATKLIDAVFDFDNNDDDQFLKAYGMTKKEAYVMSEILGQRATRELMSLETIK
jgi:hypothetical protein